MTASPNLGGMFNTDITVLTLHRFFERFCYYGFRSIIVLYLVGSLAEGGLGLDNVQALTWYGWLTALSYLSALLAGFIGDYFVRSRTLMWIGGFISTTGLFMLAFCNEAFTLPAMLTIAIGSGVYMCSHSVCIAQSYRKAPSKMDGGFLLNYIFINLGAFVGVVLISSLISVWKISFSSVFLGLGALLLVAQLALVIAHRWMSAVPPGANEEISDPPYHRTTAGAKVRMLALLLIGSMFFLAALELSTTLNYEASMGNAQISSLLYSQSFNFLLLVSLLVMLILLKAFTKVSSIHLLAFGFLCAATAFFYQFTQLGSMSYFAVILVAAGITVSEGMLVLISPILCRYFPQRHFGKLFGLTFLMFSLSRAMQTVFGEFEELKPVILVVCALVLLLIAVAMLMLRPAPIQEPQIAQEAEEYI